jgi:hypothetical protein
MGGYENKHYFRPDETGRVVYAFSDAYGYEDDPTCIPLLGDVLVGEGERQFHAVITNERGQFTYKVVDGEVVERSAEELAAEWDARPPEPETPEQKIARLEAALAASEATALAQITVLKARDSQIQDDVSFLMEMVAPPPE